MDSAWSWPGTGFVLGCLVGKLNPREDPQRMDDIRDALEQDEADEGGTEETDGRSLRIFVRQRTHLSGRRRSVRAVWMVRTKHRRQTTR